MGTLGSWNCCPEPLAPAEAGPERVGGVLRPGKAAIGQALREHSRQAAERAAARLFLGFVGALGMIARRTPHMHVVIEVPRCSAAWAWSGWTSLRVILRASVTKRAYAFRTSDQNLHAGRYSAERVLYSLYLCIPDIDDKNNNIVLEFYNIDDKASLTDSENFYLNIDMDTNLGDVFNINDSN